jgi:hypothetical protein
MMANANQANEDNDLTGDVCDNCPPFPSNGADADNDGVGDACDPNLLIPGDSITLFEGFSGGSIPTGWTAVGTWMVADGNLVSLADGGVLSTLVIPYAHTPRQTISAFATIIALTSDVGGSIGVADRFDGTQGLHCGGGRTGGDIFGLINAANGVPQDVKPHPFAVGTLYRITATRADNNHECTTVQANGNTVTTQTQFASANGSNIGFRNRTASAAFPWIMVVKSP